MVVSAAPAHCIRTGTTPTRGAAFTAILILCNSVVGLAGVLLAGETPAPGVAVCAVAALAGAIIGTTVGMRWMSERYIRYVLATILLFSGSRLLFR